MQEEEGPQGRCADPEPLGQRRHHQKAGDTRGTKPRGFCLGSERCGGKRSRRSGLFIAVSAEILNGPNPGGACSAFVSISSALSLACRYQGAVEDDRTPYCRRLALRRVPEDWWATESILDSTWRLMGPSNHV